MGQVISLPYCQKKQCSKILHNLNNRWYIDILNGFIGNRIACKEKGYKFPEGLEIGATPIVGPYCNECVSLLCFTIYGMAPEAYFPEPKR